jgi:glucose uptake protein GlcU
VDPYWFLFTAMTAALAVVSVVAREWSWAVTFGLVSVFLLVWGRWMTRKEDEANRRRNEPPG